MTEQQLRQSPSGRDQIPALSHALEDYLKAIYKLSQRVDKVGTTAVAEYVGVSAPSVTGVVGKLAGLGLVVHEPYRSVKLTPAGEKIALEIIRHHRLLELYLSQALGLSWDKVDAEAEKLEHIISEEVEELIDQVLGHPTTDPHGAAIPTRDGVLDEVTHPKLHQVPSGRRAAIRGVSDADPALLRYLASLGLVPEVIIEVVEHQPFGGPVVVRVGSVEHALGREAAESIFVAVFEDV